MKGNGFIHQAKLAIKPVSESEETKIKTYYTKIIEGENHEN
jgi:hypothetical protein